MKKRIGFVAIGQAGGNIGQLFEEYGYSVLYLNTSEEDLSTLTEAKHKYHITGGEGCNKDRGKAKQLVIDDFDNIAGRIDDTLNCEFIFVIFAAGGGTGSGAGPMLIDLLLDEESGQDKEIGAITILPGCNETLKSQVNAYECFSELLEIENICSTFIIDNDKGDKMQLNAIFAKNFNDYVSIPEKYKSERGNIDAAEIIESLKAHGAAIVYSLKTSDDSKIIQNLNNNIYAPLEADHVVKYISYACANNVFDDIEKAIGTPWDSFRAYSDEAHSVVLASGLSYPLSRLDNVHNFIQSKKDVIVQNLSGKFATLKNDFDFLQPAAKPDVKRKSRNDIINRYCRKG